MSNTLPAQDGIITAAVAIDRDKNSQHAVKWAIDNLPLNKQITLVHVLTQQTTLPQDVVPKEGRAPTRDELQQFFLPFRGFCARKGIRVKEIILHDIDVSNALANYIIENSITIIVLGTANRSALTSRAFKNFDVPTGLSRCVPDFCTLYSVSKTKSTILKQATRPLKTTSSWQSSSTGYPSSVDSSRYNSFDDGYNRQESWRSSSTDKSFESSVQRRSTEWSTSSYESNNTNNQRKSTEWSSNDRSFESSNNGPRKSTEWSRGQLIPPPINNNKNSGNGGGGGGGGGGASPINSLALILKNSQTSPSYSVASSSEFSGPQSYRSPDVSFEHLDYSRNSDASSSKFSISSQATGDIEDELTRLKKELKQTMDLYNSACKETVSATEKVKEIDQWKSDEARKIAESKQAQEAALAMVEREKQKCMAALEAAKMAQRLAELEAQKRKLAEMRYQKETEEKKKAMDALASCDIRYRKYSIEEIEVATKYFAVSEKIGEGGYGPVYKGYLDHTAVAIKVLRPDISQGQEQFQREIEVLSHMRHPNMVLLLGACPEYGCLVYEYMDRGSLEDRLFCRSGSPPMPWKTRFRIAAEIATALHFLHQTKPEPLVHRDLKPANILLDRNYVSKIGDVGLSRLVPPTIADTVTQYHMTAAAGTFCYIDPEYQQTGMLGTKSDIYSLGIMLLQIITAKPAMGLTYQVEDAIENGRFAQMLDPKITDWPIEDTLSFAKLSLKCCELRRKDRPDLGSVILPELERLRDLGSESETKSGNVGMSIHSMESYADSVSYSQEANSIASEI